MPIEKFRNLAASPETNQSLQSALTGIIEELRKEIVWSHPSKFTPLAIFVFGSTLDKDRFDRDLGLGERSDLDFLVVVAEDFFADDVYRIGTHRSSSNAVNFVHLQRSAGQGSGWSSDRDLDVIMMSVQNIAWELSRIESLTDPEVAELFPGDTYLTALASGFALFNYLDESQLKGLFRLQRIYHELEVKSGH